jgi:hypothetical protein
MTGHFRGTKVSELIWDWGLEGGRLRHATRDNRNGCLALPPA